MPSTVRRHVARHPFACSRIVSRVSPCNVAQEGRRQRRFLVVTRASMNVPHSLPTRAARRARGFTLVEMVITIAVIAILASVAWPSYESYVRRSKRATAQSALMTIANREQAHLLDLRGYTTSLAALNV